MKYISLEILGQEVEQQKLGLQLELVDMVLTWTNTFTTVIWQFQELVALG